MLNACLIFYSFPDSTIQKITAKNISRNLVAHGETAKKLQLANGTTAFGGIMLGVAGVFLVTDLLYLGYLNTSGSLNDPNDRREFLIINGLLAGSTVLGVTLILGGQAQKRKAIKRLMNQ